MLASKKPTVIAKGKNQDIEKWEAELRKSIATKKASANTTLSKQDRALVDAQLKVESETRKKVLRIKAEAERGFGLIRSAVNSRVVQFEQHASALLTLLLGGALRLGTPLVGSHALNVYFVRIPIQCRTAHMPYIMHTYYRLLRQPAQTALGRHVLRSQQPLFDYTKSTFFPLSI